MGRYRAPVEMVYTATEVVGNAFGADAACAEAAALLKLIVGRLGWDVRPRPVAVFARNNRTSTEAVMGPAITDYIENAWEGTIEDRRPEGTTTDSGHLVLTHDDPALMLDPNIRQLRAHGFDVPSIVLRVASATPDNRMWQWEDGDCVVLYALDETNTALLPRYEAALKHFEDDARIIREMIRDGLSADEITALMSSR